MINTVISIKWLSEQYGKATLGFDDDFPFFNKRVINLHSVVTGNTQKLSLLVALYPQYSPPDNARRLNFARNAFFPGKPFKASPI